jgi:hypothetical protein
MKNPIIAAAAGASRRGIPLKRSPEGIAAISRAARARMLSPDNPMRRPEVLMHNLTKLNAHDHSQMGGENAFAVWLFGQELGFVSGWPIGGKVPDFVAEHPRKIIEHTASTWRGPGYAMKRIRLWASHGWSSMVIFIPPGQDPSPALTDMIRVWMEVPYGAIWRRGRFSLVDLK